MPPALTYWTARDAYGFGRCDCGKPCKLVQSKRDNGNKNRWFWACEQSPQCKAFVGWADGQPNMSGCALPQQGEVNSAPPPAPAPPGPQPPVSQYRQAGSPQQPPAGRHYSTPASGGAAARRLPASMGQVHLAGSPPGMNPQSAGRGGLQHSSSPQTPPSARRSQQLARTPQGGAGLRFQQLDSQRFSVSFPFDRDVVESLKQTFSYRDREWHPDSKTWRFDMDKYQEVQNWALEHFAATEITLLEQTSPPREIPTPHVESDYFVQAHIAQYIPPEKWDMLYGFQKEGVQFALKHSGRVLIADDMGLGKTVQAILVAACFCADWPLLVVCPSSVTLAWLEQLNDWLPDALKPDPANLVVITSGKDVDKKLDLVAGPPTSRHIVIASYDCAQKLRGYERHFGMLICDESHMLKSPGSKRTQFFSDLTAAGAVRRLIFLTGTPVLSRPIEAYTQIDMLRPGLMGSYDQFGERYCGAKVQVAPGKMDWRGAQNLEELNGILCEHLLIRRLKKDVLHELPKMRRDRKTILPNPDLLPMIEDVKRKMAALEASARHMSDADYDGQKRMLLMELYRATGPAKVKAAVERIEELLGQGRKLLVFAHHKGVLDSLENAVEGMRVGEDGRMHQVGHMRIDGRSSAQARGDAVAAFQRDPNCRVALLSIRAAGAGITLHAANTVLFVELAWTPAELTQAEARAHRLGQEQEVDVQYLLAPGSADDIIWSMVHSKLRVVGNALDGHLAGTATGLRITDSRQFVGWAVGGAVGALPSDDEDEGARIGAGPSSQQLTTPEAPRDTRPEPSGSGARRQRSASPDNGGRSGARRRRLDFGGPSTSLQVQETEVLLSQASNSVAGSHAGTIVTQPASRDTLFSDSDDVWNAGARVSRADGLPLAPTQRMPSQPSQPGAGPSSQRNSGGGGGGGGLGVFENDHDDEFDAVIASPEMDAVLSQRSSQQQPSQPERLSQEASASAGRRGGSGGRGGGRRADAEQPMQPYFPAQPPYSPYGQPPQRGVPPAGAAAGGTARGCGHASAWDYPAQPKTAEVVDLSVDVEEVIELE